MNKPNFLTNYGINQILIAEGYFILILLIRFTLFETTQYTKTPMKSTSIETIN